MKIHWAVTVVGVLGVLIAGSAMAGSLASDGTRLALSSGSLPSGLMNQIPLAAMQQAEVEGMGLSKAYRKVLLHEIVWFDGKEADLEKHAFRQGGQIYITLTDLARHVGGNIVWGPDASYIMVERGGKKVRVMAGSARVVVNGRPQSLGTPAVRLGNRTFVPVRAMLRIFGVNSQWNAGARRLYVELNRR
jgi:hypothetical protein